MERLNTALDRLREIIPSASEKRVSKIKTLKMAIAYIDYLQVSSAIQNRIPSTSMEQKKLSTIKTLCTPQNLLLRDETLDWDPRFPYGYQHRYFEYPPIYSPPDGSRCLYTNSQ